MADRRHSVDMKMSNRNQGPFDCPTKHWESSQQCDLPVINVSDDEEVCSTNVRTANLYYEIRSELDEKRVAVVMEAPNN